MSQHIKLRCVDPIQSLSEGGIYTSERIIKEKGIYSTHFADWSEATHVLVRNDDGEIVRTLANRFEKVDEQRESKAPT